MMRIILLLLLSFTAVDAGNVSPHYWPWTIIRRGEVISLYEAGQLLEARNAMGAAVAHTHGFEYSAVSKNLSIVENAIAACATLSQRYYDLEGTIPLSIAHQLAQGMEEQALREDPANPVYPDADVFIKMKIDIADIVAKFDSNADGMAEVVFLQGVIRGCFSSFVRIGKLADTATKRNLLLAVQERFNDAQAKLPEAEKKEELLFTAAKEGAAELAAAKAELGKLERILLPPFTPLTSTKSLVRTQKQSPRANRRPRTFSSGGSNRSPVLNKSRSRSPSGSRLPDQGKSQ